MKILMLCDAYFIDFQYQENLIAKSYIKLGYEVVVITNTNEKILDFINDIHDNSLPEKIEYDNGVKIYREPYSINILHRVRRFKNVKRILDQEKPDFLFSHDIQFNIGDLVDYKKKYNTRIIMDYHADFSNSGKNWVSINILHKIIRKKYLYRYKKYIDKIYPVVPAGEEFLHKIYGISYDEMELLPLGCEYDECEKFRKETDIIKLREEYGISPNDIVIITGGKFHKLKRTDLAVKAVKKINQKNVHMIVFGTADKNHEEYLKTMLQDAEGANIHFTGWADSKKIYELMAISDIALFPASQSVLWQQSIGMHLPLIAGDAGGQDMSYLNQNGNLIKIDASDINEDFIKEILLDLIQNPEKIESMKKGAEKTAKEYLDYSIIAKRTLS
ncbi:glycosyltransferase family 4 protein [Chryseobacterium sp.]|uniref:glycosyltransferase family 4 protein n=1 Tax=Chryseobacterium sp. TaxID=1871047 RepID=UPI0031E1A365